MRGFEQGGSLSTVEPLPFNYFYDHIVSQDEKVLIDDYSFEGLDPRRISLPGEAVLLRAVIDIDAHTGGYFIAIAQVDGNGSDSCGVAAYRVVLERNTFGYGGLLTFIAPEITTWFGANPKEERERGLPTVQLSDVTRGVSDTHIGLTLDADGSLLATDVSENRTWRLSLNPQP